MFQALRIYLNDDEKADKYLDFIKGSESIVKNLNNSISDKVFSPRGIQIVDSITDAIEIHKRRHTRYNFLKSADHDQKTSDHLLKLLELPHDQARDTNSLNLQAAINRESLERDNDVLTDSEQTSQQDGLGLSGGDQGPKGLI